jgi:hypothetical protein
VLDSQGRPEKLSLIQASPLYPQPPTLRRDPHSQILGFRFGWTEGVSFDILINIMSHPYRDDIIATNVISPRDGETLEMAVEPLTEDFYLRYTKPKVSDRIVYEIPSRGIVIVSIKKLGHAWNPAPCGNGGREYSKTNLFCLKDGGMEEKSVKDDRNKEEVDVRYLVDVRLSC